MKYSRAYNYAHDGQKQEKEQTKAVDVVRTYDNRSKTKPDTKEDSKVSLKKCNFVAGTMHLASALHMGTLVICVRI